ncbi:hypothetical protein [Demequina rhizosphaerae]|uniref:hypothetical protein n=1 Tax=Demequina rhizosphaerae TaxID=1638985 RepID=UPI0007841980|nr:hypothetical protein [Demequina rhizosphaerae]
MIMWTLLKNRNSSRVPVVAKGLGLVAGLVGAAAMSMGAVAVANDTDDTTSNDDAAVGYVYSGGSWGSTESLSDTGSEADDVYTPMPCVPDGACGRTSEEDEAYTPMPCVPEGAYGATEEEATDEDATDDAYEPMCGGVPPYAVDDYEPICGGLPPYAVDDYEPMCGGVPDYAE